MPQTQITFDPNATYGPQFDPAGHYAPALEFQKPPLNLKEKTTPTPPPDPLSEQIKSNPFRALQLPFEALGQTASEAHDKLADQMLADAAKGKGVSKTDYVKSFLLGSGADASHMVASSLSPEGVATGIATAVAPEVMGPMLAAHGAIGAAENVPGAVRGDPNAVQNLLLSGAEAAGGAAATGSSLHADWQAGRAKIKRLAGAMQTPQEAAQLPPGAPRARAVSNQDVINEAVSEGIDLTPAQTTRERSAQLIQGVGEQTLTPGGQQLQDALEANKGKFAQSIENFARRHDPYALGLSPESAGQTLQTSAKVALEVAKDNAAIAYKQAGIDQANIAVDVRAPLQKFVDAERSVKQPAAAVAQPEYKSPAVEAALKDIESKIADPRLGKNMSVQSARNLRTELWEKGNDYSGTIPAAAQAIYKRAAQIPDDAMMSAAQGTPFEESFRDASAQWKALKSKFDEPGQPLQRLLQAGDAKAAYNSVVGGKSADVITKLKAEKIDLAPVQSQVLQDIAAKGFRATGNTLAGYPDSFLQQLFGPAAAKELYVKAEIGRRLNMEVNPSGSGRIRIAWDQMGWNPASWARGETAAQASMPRNPASFVAPTLPAQPPNAFAARVEPGALAARVAAGSRGAGLIQSAEGQGQ